MRTLSPEQLFLLAMLVLFGIFNFAMDLARKRRGGPPPLDREMEPEPEPMPAPVRGPDAPPRAAPAAAAPPMRRPSVAPLAAAGVAPGRRRRRAWVDPAGARRGVILMTVLGPCRGLQDPHGTIGAPGA